jgi:cytidylate kinase
MGNKLIITIDGPAGAGKSTVAKALARRLGYKYLDTGATYRALALKAIREGIRPDDLEGLKRLSSQVLLQLGPDGRIFLDGEDVSEKIREQEVGMMASFISRIREIREVLWAIQRKVGQEGGIVAEGRDTGSVVFPDADVKFYLDASLEERARRRYRELLSKDKNVTFQEVLEEVKKRDLQDQTREIAPLKIPEGAIFVDSTHLTPEEVVELMLEKIREKL